MQVKIATYNVNGVNGRLDVFLRWLGEARPDAVVLQELKAPDHKFSVRQLEAAGYEWSFAGPTMAGA